jgi:hypothetical protein
MATTSYPKRTEKNVLDSDGTLIFSYGVLSGGSALTRTMAKKHNRPWLHIDLNVLSNPEASEAVRQWVEREGIQVLNVAGPRASKDPGVYDAVCLILETALNHGRKP